MPDSTTAQQVVIVGGGITGLSAAWYLQQAGVSYALLEGSERWGGKVHTVYVDDFVIETGADAFLTRKPWALALARELGLSARIMGVNRQHSGTFVLTGGKLVRIPDGVQLIAPTQPLAFLRSPLFSWRGKLRMYLDLFISPRMDDADESLGSFVRRRVGAEAIDKLAEPLLAGIYNAETDRLSILATFPQYRALEKDYGSLIRGLNAMQTERSGKISDQPAFISFERGTQEIIDALTMQLTGDLRLNCPAKRIDRLDDGRYRIALADDSALEADAVILATPAKISARLLISLAAAAAALLADIRYTSVGAAALAFRRADVPHPLDGLGVVIPGSERRMIDGITFATTKWERRAPKDQVLLRVFFGGPHSRDMMNRDDAAVLETVRAELESMLGIGAAPVMTHITRWHDAYPQYDVGHLERVAAIEQALPARLYVTGSSYRGIGVPDCVKQGKETAGRVAKILQQFARQSTSIATDSKDDVGEKAYADEPI